MNCASTTTCDLHGADRSGWLCDTDGTLETHAEPEIAQRNATHSSWASQTWVPMEQEHLCKVLATSRYWRKTQPPHFTAAPLLHHHHFRALPSWQLSMHACWLAAETQAVTCTTMPTSMSAQQAYYVLTALACASNWARPCKHASSWAPQKQDGPASGWRAICSHAPGACARTHLPLWDASFRCYSLLL
jgi:hypothetical protein